MLVVKAVAGMYQPRERRTMIGFLFGLAIGLFVSAVSLVSIMGGYNPPLVPEWEAFAEGLAYYLLALSVAAAVTLGMAMTKQIRADRQEIRLRAANADERDSLL